MSAPEIHALTLYGKPIPKALTDRKTAIQWAEENASTYPGCRIVVITKSGPRTIWRDDSHLRLVRAA